VALRLRAGNTGGPVFVDTGVDVVEREKEEER
jgi:hypothetical protein